MRLRYQVRKSNSQSNVSTFKRTRFDFYVSTLIIVTFGLFTTVPNTFRTTVFLCGKVHHRRSLSIFFLIPFGYFCDPLIFIFSVSRIFSVEFNKRYQIYFLIQEFIVFIMLNEQKRMFFMD